MNELVSLLKEATYPVFFTGAGMSTESGLPDFRSKSRGLWEKFNPDELANINALHDNRDEFIKFYQYRLSEINQYEPHRGHYILGEWEQTGRLKSIITQNVDGFHHDAGSKNVQELHGSFRKLNCHNCGDEFNREEFISGTGICPCGGAIRPGIVLFGEMLPQDTFRIAEEETEKADLFIVLGSSLSVSPANMFPMLAKEQGAKLVIINREATQLDHYADLIIQDKSIKEVLIEVDDMLDDSF